MLTIIKNIDPEEMVVVQREMGDLFHSHQTDDIIYFKITDDLTLGFRLKKFTHFQTKDKIVN